MSIFNLSLQMLFRYLRPFLLITTFIFTIVSGLAQAGFPVPDHSNNKPGSANEDDHNRRLEQRFLRNLAKDQVAIWTSPLRVKPHDSWWLMPSAVLTGELLHRDAYLYGRLAVGRSSASAKFSDAGLGVMGGVIGASYLLGRIHNAPQARETGILGTQAAINSLAVSYALNYSLGRQRPFSGDGRGSFFHTGKDAGSFPSTHAMLTWSMASVFAHEYPGALSKVGIYGLASAVSVARITGRKHFPADVVVGSALGWAIGRHVYKTHHDEELGGASIGTIVRDDETIVSGSPYVSLDHWAYQAFDRLTVMGLVDSGFLGLRPWTRRECARLVDEADLRLDLAGGEGYASAQPIIATLRKEFADATSGVESRAEARVESLYVRFMGISGLPLNDGYHFGQTVINDFGRPYREGLNVVAGASSWGRRGRWSFFLRGEYQEAPSGDPLSLPTRSHISQVDFLPLQPAVPFKQVNRARLIDAHVAVDLHDWQISAGRQSLWWGPAGNGSLMLSNNAEPLLMVRINRTIPLILPSLLGWLGPIRGEVFLGQLSGHRFVRTAIGDLGPGLARQPFIHGGKLSLKPTRNLELGFSVTTIWGGPEPLTLRTFWRSIGISNTVPGQVNDPGDRRAGFDFRYRVPGLRKWLTLYNESFTEDEISPLAFPRRAAMNPGLILSHVPGLPKLDLRAEGFYTDLPGLRPFGFLYFNNKYLDGYTNGGNLIGHWIGRQGSGYAAQARYWFNSRNVLTVEHRRARVSEQFVPGGGSMHTTVLNGTMMARPDLELSGRIQYERWRFAPLDPARRSDVTVHFQMSFFPSNWRIAPARSAKPN